MFQIVGKLVRLGFKSSILTIALAVSGSTSVFAQNMNSLIQRPPRETPPLRVIEAIPPGEPKESAVPTPFFTEIPINANYLGRAALVGDDVRLAKFAGGTFLPSAIPASGEPFFDSGARANLQGEGSAVSIDGYLPTRSDVRVSAHTQFLVNSARLSSTGDISDSNIAISQAFGRINRLSIGVMETAFADPAAMPEIIDLAGPNARVTSFPGGLGKGQGRISYDFFADDSEGGFTTTVSLEQPQPQIVTGSTEGTFARYPDFVVAAQYVEGFMKDKFYEQWHLQFASLVRDLGLENDTATVRDEAFGWGVSLSGALHLESADVVSRNRIVFSVAYGEGISRYITDLNAAPNTNDATIDVTGTLTALPVLAWYAGYTHNWSENLRSTATFSQVSLDSVLPLAAGASPYRKGDFVAVNLVYHRPFQTGETPDEKKDHNFYTGIEYLFGSKETLAADGDAQRIMWVTAISK